MLVTENDPLIFGIFILCGLVCGIIFDIFKIIRKSFGERERFTNVCDALFWTLFTIFFLWLNFKSNDGNIRWFLFFGIFMGTFIYFLLFSKVFVFTGVFLTNIIKKVFTFVLKILFYPALFIARKMKKAAFFVYSPFLRFRKKGGVLKRFIKRKWHIFKFCSKKI